MFRLEAKIELSHSNVVDSITKKYYRNKCFPTDIFKTTIPITFDPSKNNRIIDRLYNKRAVILVKYLQNSQVLKMNGFLNSSL